MRRCGYDIDPYTLKVTHNGRSISLPHFLFRTLHLIMLFPGIDAKTIFDVMYGEDSDGGPVQGPRAIQTYRCLLNRRIAPLGLIITTTRRYRGKYELKEINNADTA